MSDQADRPLVDNDTVWAFLEGDGADPEAFETLRRRITLAVPYILDSEVGRDYAVAKLAEAEKRGAAKALRVEAKRGLEAVEAAKTREGPFKDFAVHLMGGLARELVRRADAIESGEMPL